MSAFVEFCGERFDVPAGGVVTIGREADVVVDDNPFLHRRFLEVSEADGLCWLTNVGSRLSATVTDATSRMQAWLAPGARLPLVFEVNHVRFAAGPTTYELSVGVTESPFSAPAVVESHSAVDAATDTIGQIPLTPSQKLLVVALSEPLLRQEGRGSAAIPTSADAARRLGWPLSTFNRKLDNVCEKLTRAGVRGLKGGVDRLATNRRARLVEYAVAVGLVTTGDLVDLDADGNDALTSFEGNES